MSVNIHLDRYTSSIIHADARYLAIPREASLSHMTALGNFSAIPRLKPFLKVENDIFSIMYYSMHRNQQM